MVLANYIAIATALAGIIALMVQKFEADGISFIRSNNLAICNLAFTSFCALLNVIGIGISAWHLMQTWHAQWYGVALSHV